jgi:peptide/nickel transport system permease protein
VSITITDNRAAARGRTRPSSVPAAWIFLAKRLGFYLVTAAFAVTLNFAIPRFMPGDPVSTMIKQITQETGAPPSASAIAQLRAIYGDPTKNLIGQYATYLDHLAHFDLGISSTQYPTPVSHLILVALPWTLSLVTVTTVLAWIIGTLLGAWLGSHPGGRADSWLTSGTTFINAIPAFWLGMLFLGLFSFMLHWFPSAGGYDPNVPYDINNVWFWLSTLRYGALPAFTLVFIGFSGWLFSMRNVMVTTVSEDYVQLARAKGLPRRTVLFRYAARNALLPNVTGLAHAIGYVIGGVVLVETTFTYPGMGYLLEQAVTTHDFPVMQAIFIMITLAVLVSNFIADSLYVLLDPRTREEDA